MSVPVKLESAVILAGGKGSRLGYDKKQIVFKNETLIDTLIGRLRPYFSEILVSSNTEFQRENITVIADELGAGPLAGIYSALKICRSEYLYVTACDMPFISGEYIERLKQAVQETGCEAALTRRPDGFWEPFNALYRKTALPVLKAQLEAGVYKAGLLFSKLTVCDAGALSGAFNEKEFFNINYEADLAEAQKLDAIP
jgi:molybdopterin-guanine dinucleotide biosynthesis protein A